MFKSYVFLLKKENNVYSKDFGKFFLESGFRSNSVHNDEYFTEKTGAVKSRKLRRKNYILFDCEYVFLAMLCTCNKVQFNLSCFACSFILFCYLFIQDKYCSL